MIYSYIEIAPNRYELRCKKTGERVNIVDKIVAYFNSGATRK